MALPLNTPASGFGRLAARALMLLLALARSSDDGRIIIDNTAAERVLRGVALRQLIAFLPASTAARNALRRCTD